MAVVKRSFAEEWPRLSSRLRSRATRMNDCPVLILVGGRSLGLVARVTFVAVDARGRQRARRGGRSGRCPRGRGGVGVRVGLYRVPGTVDVAYWNCYGGNRENHPDVIPE